MWKSLVGAAAVLCLAACSPGNDLAITTPQIAAFHQQLDAQDFNGVYQQADPTMKAASSESDLVALLTAIHKKLGPFQSGSVAGWNDNINTQGHFLTVNYQAKYQRGAAVESFVYRVDARPPRLAGYHVSSNALILN